MEHNGSGFWWEGFMEETGREDSLEGVKDFNGEKNEPRDTEKVGQKGVCEKPGIAQ